MKILGIETSCDETAAAVVEDGIKVHSNVIASSMDLHTKTGGVVPEVAAREHLKQINPVIDEALEKAGVGWGDIDAIAVTHAPGLIASLLVGVNTAQALSYLYQKPLIPTHHIAGHIYANFLERSEPIQFPILVLTVSGGHNELVRLKGHHEFESIGETLDDAAGEAFDKVARMLGLGYPGGPIISKRAAAGNPAAFNFPRVHLDKNNRYNFSFSGLKSAVLRQVENLTKEGATLRRAQDHSRLLSETDINNLAASFQAAVIDVLSDKLVAAAEAFDVKEVHLAGGVSANQSLRQAVTEKLNDRLPLCMPQKLIYCTDNAAMIAGAAYFCIKNTGSL
ncbi:tRNA (adenosine(37)-N6)-threonylcarbamoyltransferase complex transferase subunit TsaD [Candidatus Peregrinibacteria bacterium]|nr:MAG: tRNA (adenosine(37)-N6)-threonylcarbamoyltransferase complex transferase subunit TsaD [Candidatus Peregrinibacteria bacterium]